jgi:aminopeptidase N
MSESTLDKNTLIKRREDYSAPSHLIDTVDLSFELDPVNTIVINHMEVRVNPDSSDKKKADAFDGLLLDGEALDLISVKINGAEALEGQDYQLEENALRILCQDERFTLTITNSINPEQNTSLEGLYYTNSAFCTQCEAQGFRKISYFLDRPDVLSVYKVSIISRDPELTYLLSNGNLESDTFDKNNDTRTCVWRDPHPKPSYLFALVAGHFDKLDDSFTTQSGRDVSLQLFVDKGRLGQGQHALDSLKKAMQWDELTYGLEYDLDIYMVVAVDFFNMGAMENKGLNVFNSKFVLADPNTATDEDYFNIESIIAHEYFHNWTGNRVTCRDWFQLSLKEGLTVFRDQKFSADMFSDLITRISQVKVMREHQFAEDAGPMSHPIRPDVVMEMNNFYTVTVYDKGAEVIRMLHTLLGVEGFRAGMDLYFSRFDGQAVTCDDFVNAMQDANNKDLSHFKRWYSQSGTPIVKVNLESKGKQTALNFEQVHLKTADQTEKHPLYIPIKLECFNGNGEKLHLDINDDTFVLDSHKGSLLVNETIANITPSLLQDFSAPVKVEFNYSFAQLINIIAHASNHYAKWEACQRYFTALVQLRYQDKLGTQQDNSGLIEQEITMLAQTFQTLSVPNEVLAQLLTAPSIETIMASIEYAKPLLIADAYDEVTCQISTTLNAYLLDVYESHQSKQAYLYEKTQVNTRRLKNTCLLLLAKCSMQSETINEGACSDNKVDTLISQQYASSDNMTDKLGALKAAQVNPQRPLFNKLMLTFEKEYGDDAVVMDKWFALHASTERKDILSQLDMLQSHPQFSIKNPNKVRSLIGSFAFFNVRGFHQHTGKGYAYIADYLMKLDSINPQVASRVITPLIQFAGYDESHQIQMKSELNRIFGKKGLSKDLFEKISKSLLT